MDTYWWFSYFLSSNARRHRFLRFHYSLCSLD